MRHWQLDPIPQSFAHVRILQRCQACGRILEEETQPKENRLVLVRTAVLRGSVQVPATDDSGILTSAQKNEVPPVKPSVQEQRTEEIRSQEKLVQNLELVVLVGNNHQTVQSGDDPCPTYLLSACVTRGLMNFLTLHFNGRPLIA